MSLLATSTDLEDLDWIHVNQENPQADSCEHGIETVATIKCE
jgi:hypothetical protein